jgi:hypothetical protein
MEWFVSLASTFLGYIELPFNPFLYVAVCVLWMQFRRQNRLERDLFGQRLHSRGEMLIRSLLSGLVAGLIGTFFVQLFGIVVSPYDLMLLWLVAIVLSLFETRFLCFAYAGGLLGIVSLVAKHVPVSGGLGSPGGSLWDLFRNISTPDILLLVAILHLLEAVLIWAQGYQDALPVFVESRRGKIVGGYVLQNLWLIPVISFIGLNHPQSIMGTIPMHPPTLGGAVALSHSYLSYLLTPMPVMLGFSTLTLTKHAQQKARQSALRVAGYGLCLSVLVLVGTRIPAVLWIACLFSFLVHEWMIRVDRKKEQSDTPIFIKPLRGLKLLSVFPRSPADQMGLKAGDTIIRVNGIPVNTTYDFHFAINQNPAYVKLDVIDETGELRFASKPLYAGEPHQLGVILVPDDSCLQYVVLYSDSTWSYLKRLFHSRKQRMEAKSQQHVT